MKRFLFVLLAWTVFGVLGALSLAAGAEVLPRPFYGHALGGWINPPDDEVAARCGRFAIRRGESALHSRVRSYWLDPGLGLSLFGGWDEGDPEWILRDIDERADPLRRDPSVPPREHEVVLLESGWPYRCLGGALECESVPGSSPQTWLWVAGSAVPLSGGAHVLRADWERFRALPTQVKWSGLTADTVILGGSAFALTSLGRALLALRRFGKGRCPACGFDRRGDYRHACPECGRAGPSRVAQKSA